MPSGRDRYEQLDERAKRLRAMFETAMAIDPNGPNARALACQLGACVGRMYELLAGPNVRWHPDTETETPPDGAA